MPYTVIVPPESPCGCESGKTFGECHLGPDGNIELTWKDFNPPLPMTGERVPKCHFAYTNNCGEGISKEHIISRAVLKELNDKRITFSTSNFVKQLPLNSDALKTKRLCRRHNAAFGRVDNEVGRLVRTIKKLDETLSTRPAKPIRAYLFAGFDIERWLLKTLLNIYYARLSLNPLKFSPPQNIQAGFNAPLPRPYGLYIPYRTDQGKMLSYSIQKSASFQLLAEGTQVVGIACSLAGSQFVFIMTGTRPYALEFATTHSYRPKSFVHFDGQESVSLFLGWEDGDNKDVWMSRGNPDAQIPEGIFSDYE